MAMLRISVKYRKKGRVVEVLLVARDDGNRTEQQAKSFEMVSCVGGRAVGISMHLAGGPESSYRRA